MKIRWFSIITTSGTDDGKVINYSTVLTVEPTDILVGFVNNGKIII